MHPFQQITMAQQHIDDLQRIASRHRLSRGIRRVRRRRAAPTPDPPPPATDPRPAAVTLRLVPQPDERRPAA